MEFRADNALVIANPTAGGGRVGRRFERIARMIRRILGDIPIVMTKAPGHGEELARRAIWEGTETLLSLGGDGTHSEVVGGVVKNRPKPGAITVGVLPVGTGGDFRRMIDPSPDLETHALRLRDAPAYEIDVGLLKVQNEHGEMVEKVFLNETSLGMSAEVCRRVNQSSKLFGGSVTYFANTIASLRGYDPPNVRIRVDGQEVGTYRPSVVMISNGQYAGAGMQFAPAARLADGILDVTVIRKRSIPRMVAFSPRLYRGEAAVDELTETFRGFHIEAEVLGEGRLQAEADGDPVGWLPLDASVIPGAIRMIGVRADVL